MLAEHIGISEERYKQLCEELPMSGQIAALEEFSIKDKGIPLGYVNFLIYIDRHGIDFIHRQSKGHQKIAKAIYDEMNSGEKLRILQYAEESKEMN